MKMLKVLNNYRVVHWHGFTLYIPQDHSYVAADSDGNVYSYREMPTAEDTHFGACWASDTTYSSICVVNLEGTDARTTLVVYPL